MAAGAGAAAGAAEGAGAGAASGAGDRRGSAGSVRGRPREPAAPTGRSRVIRRRLGRVRGGPEGDQAGDQQDRNSHGILPDHRISYVSVFF